MERYCWTGQSPQQAAAPTEEEEDIVAYKTYQMQDVNKLQYSHFTFKS
jgi:hypothetical protein